MEFSTWISGFWVREAQSVPPSESTKGLGQKKKMVGPWQPLWARGPGRGRQERQGLALCSLVTALSSSLLGRPKGCCTQGVESVDLVSLERLTKCWPLLALTNRLH